jgi:hypothetical protein
MRTTEVTLKKCGAVVIISGLKKLSLLKTTQVQFRKKKILFLSSNHQVIGVLTLPATMMDSSGIVILYFLIVQMKEYIFINSCGSNDSNFYNVSICSLDLKVL